MNCPRCKNGWLLVPQPGYAWCVCGYSDEPSDARDLAVDWDVIEQGLLGKGNRGRAA